MGAAPGSSGTGAPGTDLVPVSRPVTDLVRTVTSLGLGAASAAGEVIGAALDRAVPGARRPGLVGLLPGAALGLGLDVQRRMLSVTDAVERRVGSVAARVAARPVLQRPLAVVERPLVRLREQARDEQARSRALAADVVRALAPDLAVAVVEQLPVDEIVARVDVDAIVSRVDVDAIVSRVDVDAIVSRVDVAAIMDRIDLSPIVARVLDEIDIAGIVRESTGSITGEALNVGRVQAIRVDGFVERVVDRVVWRRRSRELDVPRPGA